MKAMDCSSSQKPNGVKIYPFKKKQSATREGKIFFRSRTDYLFAGVLGGLGKYWDVDSVIIRFIFSCSVLLTGGITILIYLLLAKIVPLEPARIRAE